MAQPGQKLVRVGAATHERGLHPMTVRRWIKAGRIRVVQVGREARIPRAEIERLVGTLDGRLLVLYGRGWAGMGGGGAGWAGLGGGGRGGAGEGKGGQIGGWVGRARTGAAGSGGPHGRSRRHCETKRRQRW